MTVLNLLHNAKPPPEWTAAAKSLQSCPTLCNPIDGSPPDSPVPGILQARTLEWVALSFSNAYPNTKEQIYNESKKQISLGKKYRNSMIVTNVVVRWSFDFL